jgi:tRNA G37 N-methylase TrmD
MGMCVCVNILSTSKDILRPLLACTLPQRSFSEKSKIYNEREQTENKQKKERDAFGGGESIIMRASAHQRSSLRASRKKKTIKVNHAARGEGLCQRLYYVLRETE